MRRIIRRNSIQRRLKEALTRVGYTSFDDYLFDRASKTLKQMAEELDMPVASFVVEHRRHLAKIAGTCGALYP